MTRCAHVDRLEPAVARAATTSALVITGTPKPEGTCRTRASWARKVSRRCTTVTEGGERGQGKRPVEGAVAAADDHDVPVPVLLWPRHEIGQAPVLEPVERGQWPGVKVPIPPLTTTKPALTCSPDAAVTTERHRRTLRTWPPPRAGTVARYRPACSASEAIRSRPRTAGIRRYRRSAFPGTWRIPGPRSPEASPSAPRTDRGTRRSSTAYSHGTCSDNQRVDVNIVLHPHSSSIRTKVIPLCGLDTADGNQKFTAISAPPRPACPEDRSQNHAMHRSR